MTSDTWIDPRSVDNLIKEPPLWMISFFSGQRREAAKAAQASQSASLKVGSAPDGWSSPVNPLLLASAISYSAITKSDYRSFLTRYMAGDELPDIEEALLSAPEFADEETLANFLDLEAKYAKGCRLSALLKLLSAFDPDVVRDNVEPVHDPTQFLETCWDRLASGDAPSRWEFDKYDVLKLAWLLINPALRTLDDPQKVRVSLITYGVRHNSAIHNVRQQCERRLRELDSSMNTILSASIPRDEKQRAILESKAARENAVKLVRRARRLYDWNPAEIEAHKAEELIHRRVRGQPEESLRHYGE
jgi:hypothetical protein